MCVLACYPPSLFVSVERDRGARQQPQTHGRLSAQALFNPYNVRIVPHHKINHADYFTMSAKGVTHIVSGEADFTPLRQWEREHRIFHAIFEIPFKALPSVGGQLQEGGVICKLFLFAVFFITRFRIFDLPGMSDFYHWSSQPASSFPDGPNWFSDPPPPGGLFQALCQHSSGSTAAGRPSTSGTSTSAAPPSTSTRSSWRTTCSCSTRTFAPTSSRSTLQPF